jgi:uridine kinase
MATELIGDARMRNLSENPESQKPAVASTSLLESVFAQTLSRSKPDDRSAGKDKAHIISVTGLPGSGKSTLSRILSTLIRGSVVLRHDDYSPFLTANMPGNRQLFMTEAARQSMKGGFWDNEKVAEDLQRLKQGKPVFNEYTRMTAEPAPVVILDGLIGRRHPGCGDLVDFGIMLDVPLEIALSRRLLQICRSPRSRADPESMRRQFIDVLQAYMEGGIRASYAIPPQELT